MTMILLQRAGLLSILNEKLLDFLVIVICKSTKRGVDGCVAHMTMARQSDLATTAGNNIFHYSILTCNPKCSRTSY